MRNEDNAPVNGDGTFDDTLSSGAPGESTGTARPSRTGARASILAGLTLGAVAAGAFATDISTVVSHTWA
jgi:hypothetical protein